MEVAMFRAFQNKIYHFLGCSIKEKSTKLCLRQGTKYILVRWITLVFDYGMTVDLIISVEGRFVAENEANSKIFILRILLHKNAKWKSL